MITGNNGVLQKAIQAKNKTNEVEVQEEVILEWNAVQTRGIIERWDINQKAADLQKGLQKNDSAATVNVDGNNLNIYYRGYDLVLNVTDGSLRISEASEAPEQSVIFKSFSVGEKITIAGEEFYVIENSNKNSSIILII